MSILDSAALQLAGGQESVAFRPRGGSMEPLIKSGQRITVHRVPGNWPLQPGDIVLARVRGRVYLHKVLAVRDSAVLIGNNRGGINGWTPRENVYGVVRDPGR